MDGPFLECRDKSEGKVAEMTMAEMLSEASDVVPTKTEDLTSFLKRMAKSFGNKDFPEDKWEALGDEGQEVANALIKAGTPKKGEAKDAFEERMQVDLPEIEGLDDFFANAQASATEETAPAPKKRGRPAGSTSNADKPKMPRPPSKLVLMKEMLIEDLTVTPDAIAKAIVEKFGEGTASNTTIVTVKADFINSLRVLKNKGKLTEDLAAFVS
jgi:hypothetical protein